MYNVKLHSNRTLFVVALGAGLAAVIYFPQLFPDKIVEMPLIALYLGEVGLALMSALLFYENASITQVVRLMAWIFGFSMAIGATGNFVGHHTQLLSDSVVLMNWVQLIIMNVAGVLATVTLFKLDPLLVEITALSRSPEPPLQPRGEPGDASMQVQPIAREISPAESFGSVPQSRSALEATVSTPGQKPVESAQEILDSLDISRIMRLEKSLNPEPVSLESLFREENQAAKRALGGSITPLPGPPPGQSSITPVPGEQSRVINLSGSDNPSDTDKGPARLEDRQSGKHDALNESAAGVEGAKPAADEVMPLPAVAEDDDAERLTFAPESKEPFLLEEDILLEEDTATGRPLHKTVRGIQLTDLTRTDVHKEVLEAGGAVSESFEERVIREAAARLKDDLSRGSGITAEAASSAAEAETLSGQGQAAGEKSADSMSIFQKLLQAEPFDSLLKSADAEAPSAVSEGSKAAASETLFESTVDEEVDDIFKRLVPESAHKEVSHREPDTHKEAAHREPDTDKTQEVLFEETVVNEEVDDIFKRLVPAAAQREVSSESLRQLRGELSAAEDQTNAEAPQTVPDSKPSSADVAASATTEPAAAGDSTEAPAEERKEERKEAREEVRAEVREEEREEEREEVREEVRAEEREEVRAEDTVAVSDKAVDEKKEAPPAVQSSSDEIDEELTPVLSLQAAEAKEVKEFGRLAASGSTKQEPEESGIMKTIGKMLIDVQAVENIIKSAQSGSSGPTTARIVSAEKGEDIKALLSRIDAQEGIEGCVLVGHDGLVIASSMPSHADKDTLGALSLAVLSNTSFTVDKLSLSKLRQVTLYSKDRLTIFCDVPIGVLSVYGGAEARGRLNTLLATIADIVHGDVPEIPTADISGGISGGLPALTGSDIADAISGGGPALPKAKGGEADSSPKPAAERLESKPAAPIESFAPPKEPAPAVGESPTKKESEKPAEKHPSEPAAQPSAKSSEPPARTATLTEAASQTHNELLKPSPVSDFQKAVEAAAQPVAKPVSIAPVAAELVRDLIASLAAAPPQPAPEPVRESKAKPKELKDDAASVPEKIDKPPVDEKADAPPAKLKKEESKPEAAPAKPAEKEETPAVSKPAETAASTPAKEVKEFGRLSAKSSSAPAEAEQGSMKTIGKMLIDAQAVANIIKSAETRTGGLTTARVISAARGEGIKSLLANIDSYTGVLGSLIVGHDGLVIASTLGTNMDRDLLGALCSSVHSTTNLATKKLELGELRQSVLQSSEKVTILTEVEVGVLAVFCEQREPEKLDGLLNAIEETVHG